MAEKQINQFLDISEGCIEYIEQPVESATDLLMLKNKVKVDIAADESIRKNLGDDYDKLPFNQLILAKYIKNDEVTIDKIIKQY